MSNTEMEALLDALQERLGLEFNDHSLFWEALTHRSYLNEHDDAHRHNEKLEFLGDAVLEIIVTEYLFTKYRDQDDVSEGDLTEYRVRIVNNKRLSDVAIELGLYNLLRISRGEAKEGLNSNAHLRLLANAFEALLGALYIDQGLGACRTVVDALLIIKLPKIVKEERGAKTLLQELAQGNYGITPEYRVISETGPAHSPHFVMGVYLGEKKIAEGKGISKREAEVMAATQALKITCGQ